MPAIQTSFDEAPLLLTIPGLGNSGAGHWQSLWEDALEDCVRADLGGWDRPQRGNWVEALNRAISDAGRPVVLVAHSLGCHAVAWWAALERPAYGDPVVGALLVAPPEVDVAPMDARVAAFGPAPLGPLPFPSILAASRDDPYMRFPRARLLAQFWGSHFADAGMVGHINAESDLGAWRYGQHLLGGLLRQARSQLERGLGGAVRPAPMADLTA